MPWVLHDKRISKTTYQDSVARRSVDQRQVASREARVLYRVCIGIGTALMVVIPLAQPAVSQDQSVTAPQVSAYAPAIAPFEHGDSRRTSVFADQPGASTWDTGELTVCKAPERLAGAYTMVVDAQGDIYVLEGVAPAEGISGAGVTKLDGETLDTLWRAPIEPARRSWTYPGALALHENGDLYAVTGITAARIDIDTGEVLTRQVLPDGGYPDDATYNGLLVMTNGHILAKSLYRVPGCESDGFHAFLDCGSATKLGSKLVLLEPGELDPVWSGPAPERIGGRVTAVRRDDAERVYLPGAEGLHRWIHADGTLMPDPEWPVQDYTGPGERPGAAAAVFGDYVVIQTNARLTEAPYRIVAIHQDDPEIRHEALPFVDLSPQRSFIPSKPTADWENRRVYVVDAFGGTAALDFDEKDGFSTAWRAPSRSFNFTTILGPAGERLLAHSKIEPEDADVSAMRYTGDRIVLRRAATGEQLAITPAFPPGPGLTQLPGPDGSLVYASISGDLYRISSGDVPCPTD